MRIRYLYIVFLLIISVNLSAQDKYKKFNRTSLYQDFFSITLQDKQSNISSHIPDNESSLSFTNKDIILASNSINIKGSVKLIADSIFFNSTAYSVSDIAKIEISADENRSQILFKKKASAASDTKKKNRNRISVLEDITIAELDFVRGSVVAFWSDIYIAGEVNEDVVAIYGDIHIATNSTVRGDVIAVNGKVKIGSDAVIYGEVLSSTVAKQYKHERKRRWSRHDRYFSAYGKFVYNRVDGAAPFLGFRFTDEDSLLPEILIYGGYGFASERWRFHASVQQPLFRDYRLVAGGDIHRKLMTDDNHLIGVSHNTFFALFAREDYMDYYESEGGRFYINYKPTKSLIFETGFIYERFKWLDAHPELWSLFGGSKEFSSNFGSQSHYLRALGAFLLEQSKMKTVYFKATFDNRSNKGQPRSSWAINIEAELVPSSMNDDYDFKRFSTSIKREQKIGKRIGCTASLKNGGSDKFLPIHRLYYLGGVNSLPGYDHKEFNGDKYWLTELQFLYGFEKPDIYFWLFHNAAKITIGGASFGNQSVKQSLGIGLSYGDNIRFDLAKRLDRSDDSYRIHIRFGSDF